MANKCKRCGVDTDFLAYSDTLCLTCGDRLQAAKPFELVTMIGKLMSSLADSQTIISNLPKTTDGVRMVPKGHYWAWCAGLYGDDDGCMCEVIWWQGGGDDCFNPEYTLASANEGKPDWEFFNVEWVCSTREAGLAMEEGQK